MGIMSQDMPEVCALFALLQNASIICFFIPVFLVYTQYVALESDFSACHVAWACRFCQALPSATTLMTL